MQKECNMGIRPKATAFQKIRHVKKENEDAVSRYNSNNNNLQNDCYLKRKNL
jgi:hypothetical protein